MLLINQRKGSNTNASISILLEEIICNLAVLLLTFSGKLVVHDFGQTKNNEILYEAQNAEIDYSVNDVVKNILIHPKDKTILAVTEVGKK